MAKKNKVKKPFYKKVWFWLIAVIVIVFIGSILDGEDTASDIRGDDSSEASSEKEVKKEEKKEEPKKNEKEQRISKIKFKKNDMISFVDSSVKPRQIEVKEKDGKRLVTFNYDWVNDSIGEKAAYSFSGLSMRALQNEDQLEEPDAEPEFGYDYKIPKGSEVGLTFEFYVVDVSDPIIISIESIDDNDHNKEIKVNLEDETYKVSEIR